MSQYKILVVDDEELALLIIEGILSNAGYEVLKAKSGQECIEQAKKFSPDLIILDIMMPALDGIATVLKLKNIAQTKSIPIIMCTAVKEHEDEIVAKNLGVADYIRKSPQMEGLISKVEGILKK